MASKIRFGLIGCGAVASAHAAAISSLPNAELVAVAGKSQERLASFAEAWGLEGHADFRQLLHRDDIDAVGICTPSGSHGDIAILAAEAGKHAIVEKPIEIALAKADETLAAFRSRGLRLGVISQHRFDPDVVRLKALLDAGGLGRPVLASACVHWYRDQAYYDSGGWRGTWAGDGGGVLINQGIHTVDLLLHLLGPVAEVAGHAATMTHERMETEDTAVALLRFACGALGTLSCTTSAYPGFPARIEIIGSAGSALLEGEALTKLYRNKGDGSPGVNEAEDRQGQGVGANEAEDRQGQGVGVNEAEERKGQGAGVSEAEDRKGQGVGVNEAEERKGQGVGVNEAEDRKRQGVGGGGSALRAGRQAFVRQYADFIDAIVGQREPAVTGEAGREALALVLDVYRSSQGATRSRREREHEGGEKR
ncbi:Gfo/Idh/MocA family protein [Cohnella hongkongensis]|uniref:Gfo/Idh/MocA family protein n=1 Tax=Cohnella hongkongensis TaxID=178337 RepID=A0ABV9FNQ0_9BACL